MNPELTCSICFENIHKFELFTTDCSHHFHQLCLWTWFEHQNHIKICPLCRSRSINNFFKLYCIQFSHSFFLVFQLNKTLEQILYIIRFPNFNPNIQRHKNGITPLFFCLQHSRYDIIRELLQNPIINPHIPDIYGNSPLTHAIAYNDHTFIHIMKQHKMIPKALKNLI